MSQVLAILTPQYLPNKSFSFNLLPPLSYVNLITACLDHYVSKWDSAPPISLPTNCCQINILRDSLCLLLPINSFQ